MSYGLCIPGKFCETVVLQEEYRSFCCMGFDRLESFFVILFFSFRLSAVSLQQLEACVPDSWAALRVCCVGARITR